MTRSQGGRGKSAGRSGGKRTKSGGAGKAARQAASPVADQKAAIDTLARELAKTRSQLSEAREQQTATSEVLRVISSSPGELPPVFDTILENATRICVARFGILFSYDGKLFNKTAARNAPPALLEFLEQRGAFL